MGALSLGHFVGIPSLKARVYQITPSILGRYLTYHESFFSMFRKVMLHHAIKPEWSDGWILQENIFTMPVCISSLFLMDS